MRLKLSAFRWAVGSAVILYLALGSEAISTRKSKSKAVAPPREEDYNSDSASDTEPLVETTARPSRLARKSHNLTAEAKSDGGKLSNSKIKKEDSPINVDVIRPGDLGEDELGPEDDEELKGELDLSREPRGDKNPRIYYDDTTPRYRGHSQSNHHHHPPHSQAEEGEKDEGKYYYPKNYMNSKKSYGHGHGHGLPGKRAPDHVEFDFGSHHPPAPVQHDFSGPHHHHHEDHEHEQGVEHDSPYPHGVEEHGKSKHISVYGGYHHHGHHGGVYRHHSLGDKVDAVGKALKVHVPSALLITGVSALFPNRVHVPTTPNKYRQKRSAIFRRRSNRRHGFPPPPPSPRMNMSPEFEDVPSHILSAEHRLMDDGPEIYPEFGQRYAEASSHSFSGGGGFDPFRVFKGPGPEQAIAKIQDSIILPTFHDLSDMATLSDKNPFVRQRFQSGYGGIPNKSQAPPPAPPSTYAGPTKVIPPTVNSIMEERPTPQMPMQMNVGDGTFRSQNLNQPPMRKRKQTTRKPPIYLKEQSQSSTLPQHLSELDSDNQKQNYLVKNNGLSQSGLKVNNPVKAEEEFMSSLQNLVTPDVAKAIVENKQDPPENVDLSPDGPVMGLLSSYAQHEKDTPLCQKRALCELAVKGKSPKATKFEAFLWSVATLVPDVFSEMYDLQEVFQAIRDERCVHFECVNPNLDIQLNK